MVADLRAPLRCSRYRERPAPFDAAALRRSAGTRMSRRHSHQQRTSTAPAIAMPAPSAGFTACPVSTSSSGATRKCNCGLRSASARRSGLHAALQLPNQIFVGRVSSLCDPQWVATACLSGTLVKTASGFPPKRRVRGRRARGSADVRGRRFRGGRARASLGRGRRGPLRRASGRSERERQDTPAPGTAGPATRYRQITSTEPSSLSGPSRETSLACRQRAAAMIRRSSGSRTVASASNSPICAKSSARHREDRQRQILARPPTHPQGIRGPAAPARAARPPEPVRNLEPDA